MGLQQIDAKLLKKMFLAGAINLENNKEIINELNVFPVPDGDTGTNMTMTIMSAANELEGLDDSANMEQICKAMSSGSLRGARGNSGVILSQLIRGFTKQVKTQQAVDVVTVVDACEKAVSIAYKAVMAPKEGTILTVARGISEKARELYDNGEEDLETFLFAIVEHGRYVLSQTPEMLPVLKEAGVVDSGGQGLIEVLQGALDAYMGKEVVPVAKTSEEAVEEEAPVEEIRFEYATDFKILLTRSFNIKSELDFKAFLDSVGDSCQCVVDGETVNIHVNTNDPGFVIQRAVKYGDLVDIKIDNLKIGKTCASVETKPVFTEPAKEIGFIAVSIGDGINEIFKSLGVDYIIEGGQTMNPSTADILEAVDHVNAKNIFVLPNNKNIILAANQARDLVTDKNLLVIPTKTIPQGITAVINYVEGQSADDNEANMLAEIGRVKTGQVTYAVRDTSIDGIEIKKDDFMGLGDKGIISAGQSIETVFREMITAMTDEDSELISIYYGSDVQEADAMAMKSIVEEVCPTCDVELQFGGQPIYYYVVSVE